MSVTNECACGGVTGSRTAELSPQGSPTLGQSSASEDIWVLRKPLAGKLCVWGKQNQTVVSEEWFVLCVFACGGGERSGSVGSLGSVRSTSSLQGSGNTHVLTTPAPSPHPAPTAGVNPHGLNAPGLHAQAEGVKVGASSHWFVFMSLYVFTWFRKKYNFRHFWEIEHFQEAKHKARHKKKPQFCFLFSLYFRRKDQWCFAQQNVKCIKKVASWFVTQ